MPALLCKALQAGQELLLNSPENTANSMGSLPNGIRTALIRLEAKEMELLASLLLSKKKTNLVEIRHVN